MLKKSKIETLKEQMEKARERLRANILQRDVLGQEFRELCIEEKQPFLPGAQLLEISRRKVAILKEEAELRAQERDLGAKALQAENLYYSAQRRLKEARRLIDVIDNPPPWGLGDYSPHQVGTFRRQAEQTICELA